jgi:hypothetical protein
VIEAIAKLKRTFEVAPWLKDSKNAVHMTVLDPDSDPKKPQTLPRITWKELHEATMVSPTRSELLEMLDNVSAAARNMLAVRSCDGPDAQHRKKMIDEARAVCDAELRPEDKA